VQIPARAAQRVPRCARSRRAIAPQFVYVAAAKETPRRGESHHSSRWHDGLLGASPRHLHDAELRGRRAHRRAAVLPATGASAGSWSCVTSPGRASTSTRGGCSRSSETVRAFSASAWTPRTLPLHGTRQYRL
jgi:hypothetical protein